MDVDARWTQIVAAIGAGDFQRVLQATEGATEAERAALHARIDTLPGYDWPTFYDRSDDEKRSYFARSVADGLTARAGEFYRLATFVFGGGVSEGLAALEADVVGQRSPEWRREWADRSLAISFDVVLEGVARGLIPAPERPVEPDRLAAVHNSILQLRERDPHCARPLAEVLAPESWALGWPLDLLFEVEGTTDQSLAGRDRFAPPPLRWSDALLQLARDGQVKRSRLIDKTLEALASGFMPRRASWFESFFARLDVSPDELAPRQHALFGILALPNSKSVAIALKEANALLGADLLDTRAFVSSVGACMIHRTKKIPLLALKRLESLIQRDGDASPAVLEAASIGLGHGRSDVQSGVLELLEGAADCVEGEVRTRIIESVPGLAATLQARARALVGTTPDDVDHGEGDARGCIPFQTAPPLPPLPAPHPPLPPSGTPVVPIESLEELTLEAVQHLEETHDLIREERLLDGMLRLPSPAPDNPQGKTLRNAVQRARSRSFSGSHGSGFEARHQFTSVLSAWLHGHPDSESIEDGESLSHTWEHPGTAVFRDLRLWIIHDFSQDAGHHGGGRLWSLPTHADGSIDAEEAKVRWETCNAHPEDPDRLILFARARVELSPGIETVDVPLDLVENVRRIQEYEWVRLAAHPQSKVAFPLVPGTLLQSIEGGDFFERDEWILSDPLHIRSAASLCHRYPEVAMHLAARCLVPNIDFSEARWQNRHFYESLLWPGVVLGELAHLVMAIGLGSKEIQERAMAIDCCIEAAEEGRARAETLGQKMLWLQERTLGRPLRWAAALGEVAAASPSHADFAQRTLLGALEMAPGDRPRGIGAMLERLLETRAITGRGGLPAKVRHYLASFTGSSKASKAARQLLDS